ncbi:MAG: hypothetical protein H7Z40_16185 [Phycisphaerae bacterium]|nr:hypothetical protein [Gemmatimonadaceae bacterium]
MRVTHRLYLAAFPSVLGVLAVAGLAYWGQYARVIPETILIVAAVASISTMVLSWVNVRYVAQRVDRLARTSTGAGATKPSANAKAALLRKPLASGNDELDAIEGVVTNLSSAVMTERHDRALDSAAQEARTTHYATMLATVSASATRKLDEARIPLHILLENHFGELNENQEEMLAAARAATELADDELKAIRLIAELDLGTRTLRYDRIHPADMLHAILPMLHSAAEHSGVVLSADIAPLVPPITGDGPMLQDALLTLLRDGVASSAKGASLHLVLASETGAARISFNAAALEPAPVRSILAQRVIRACGGQILLSETGLQVVLRNYGAPTTGFSK